MNITPENLVQDPVSEQTRKHDDLQRPASVIKDEFTTEFNVVIEEHWNEQQYHYCKDDYHLSLSEALTSRAKLHDNRSVITANPARIIDPSRMAPTSVRTDTTTSASARTSISPCELDIWGVYC